MLNFGQTDTVIIPGGSVKRILDANGTVVWSKYPKKKLAEPFYIENKGSNEGHIAFKGTPGITVYYSTDKVNWSTMTTGATSYPVLTIDAGKKYYFKAETSSWNGHSIAQDTSYQNHGSMYIGGNIMSLLYGASGFENKTSVPDHAFTAIFKGWSGLVSAKKLILPATTLGVGCYEEMFMSSGLGYAPSLPATTLSMECYKNMFAYTYITSMPELPATTLATDCYYWMFYYCRRLKEVRCAAKNGIYSYPQEKWLQNVSGDGVFYKTAGVSWPTGASGIPSGWTVRDL